MIRNENYKLVQLKLYFKIICWDIEIGDDTYDIDL